MREPLTLEELRDMAASLEQLHVPAHDSTYIAVAVRVMRGALLCLVRERTDRCETCGGSGSISVPHYAHGGVRMPIRCSDCAGSGAATPAAPIPEHALSPSIEGGRGLDALTDAQVAQEGRDS